MADVKKLEKQLNLMKKENKDSKGEKLSLQNEINKDKEEHKKEKLEHDKQLGLKESRNEVCHKEITKLKIETKNAKRN